MYWQTGQKPSGHHEIACRYTAGMLDTSHDTHAHSGRPAKIWSDYAREDLSYLGMAYHCYRVAHSTTQRINPKAPETHLAFGLQSENFIDGLI